MLRLRAARHLPRLDAEPAAGVSPWRSAEHAPRAAQLIGPLCRPRQPSELHATVEEALHAL